MNNEELDNRYSDSSDKDMNSQQKSTPEELSNQEVDFSDAKSSNAPDTQEAPETSQAAFHETHKIPSEPEFKYSYSSFSTSSSAAGHADKKKNAKNKSQKRLVAVMLAVLMLLMSAMMGFSGALAANMLLDRNNKQPDGTKNLNATPQGDSSIIVVKNDGSGAANTSSRNDDEYLSMTEVVKLVKDSVVEITTGKANYRGVVVKDGAGSGVIYGLSSDGKTALILTNNHVIEGADKIVVRLTDGRQYDAEVIGSDAVSDIAVISIKPEGNITAATLGNSDSLLVGESVIAIGNPLGELGGTVTNGIISALAREVEIGDRKMTLLQTSAAVNPGNSGGGLFNMKGELIGIVNAKSSGSYIDNIGFAIPINTAHEVAVELKNYGYVTGRPDHGLELVTIDSPWSAYVTFGTAYLPYGVYVVSSELTDELKWGDMIISIDETLISSESDVDNAIMSYKVGDTVKVKVQRGNKLVEVDLTLAEYKPAGLNTVTR